MKSCLCRVCGFNSRGVRGRKEFGFPGVFEQAAAEMLYIPQPPLLNVIHLLLTSITVYVIIISGSHH